MVLLLLCLDSSGTSTILMDVPYNIAAAVALGSNKSIWLFVVMGILWSKKVNNRENPTLISHRIALT